MIDHWGGLIEALIVFTLTIGFGVQQLLSLHRLKRQREDAERRSQGK